MHSSTDVLNLVFERHYEKTGQDNVGLKSSWTVVLGPTNSSGRKMGMTQRYVTFGGSGF